MFDWLGNPMDALTDRMFGKGRKAGDVIGDWWKAHTAAGVPTPPDRYAYTAPNTDGNALHRWEEMPVGGRPASPSVHLR